MRITFEGTEIIINNNANQYHLRACASYIGVQSPYNEKIIEAAKSLGGTWKAGARMWAIPWDKAEEAVKSFAAIRIPGYTLTVDEDVAYEARLIEE